MQGKKISVRKLKAVDKLIEPWFLFSLVWSVGATCDGDSRKKFDAFIREKISQENVHADSLQTHVFIVLMFL